MTCINCTPKASLDIEERDEFEVFCDILICFEESKLWLVTTVLLANTEAGWFRRAISKIKNGIKKAVDKVKDFVKRHGPRIIDGLRRVIAKRSADNPCSPEQEEELQEAELMVQQLAEACPTFGIDPNVGLTAEAVQYAFDASDDTYEECVVMELSKKK